LDYEIEIWVREPDADEVDPFKSIWFDFTGSLEQAIDYCKGKLNVTPNSSGSAQIFIKDDEEYNPVWSV
jgi:hypothetical protein